MEKTMHTHMHTRTHLPRLGQCRCMSQGRHNRLLCQADAQLALKPPHKKLGLHPRACNKHALDPSYLQKHKHGKRQAQPNRMCALAKV